MTSSKFSNVATFSNFIKRLSDELSSVENFKCRLNGASACYKCSCLERYLDIYIDLATLEEIVQERRSQGNCGFIYCHGRVPKGEIKSRYKIDLNSFLIFERNVYYSFCSVACIDKQTTLQDRVAKSLMETQRITPQIIKTLKPNVLERLWIPHGNCGDKYQIGNFIFNILDPETMSIDEPEPDGINVVPIIEAIPPDDPTEPVEQKSLVAHAIPVDPVVQTEIVIPDPMCIHGNSEPPKSANERKVTFDLRNEPEERKTSISASTLSPFALMWYTLSRWQTLQTRQFFSMEDMQLESDEEIEPPQLFQACMQLIPEDLKLLVQPRVKAMLDTFDSVSLNIASIFTLQKKLQLEPKIVECMAMFLVCLLFERLVHLEHDDDRIMALANHLQASLKRNHGLEEESIDILKSLVLVGE
ncbi:bifunctional Rtr1-RPAP2 domain/Rtr1-RPAP2 domain superfamily [Babesia duncani]|uniref:Bifunctional Rtr1-RPAP2 domain/Rtr1-RPAP2 domain superfamily n=1 Tax=Babesia duncani TaxID=323732 RepID=A0AAD9UQB0_9APIC|nr:bifunctional Rtr1-RPAP2 domain/Rtr1-RPAP2 domain superfamily [Babesia duncani]